eukprot:scaffold8288_cov129-Cylindrotheca_fusiformis.AAC.8
MRVDEGTTYCLPALKCDCCFSDDDKNVPSSSTSAQREITLDLQGLPMIHDDGVQTGVGARGWYNSAVLSAMMILGHEEMHRDLKLQSKPNMSVLELGAGALGLVGMTMAWILSQNHQQVSASKVLLTDNDPECLQQLDRNVESVFASLQDYHRSMNSMEHGEESKSCMPLLPEITTSLLDWDDHNVDQAALMGHEIDLVVGAELAYTTNNSLALQVAKILELHPKAVVWIVQFPRNGWFQVFQMQLKQKNPNICIHKIAPDSVHDEVHTLAQRIMPTPIMCGNLNDIKALRITLQEEEVKKEPKTASFDLAEQIRQAQRTSEHLHQEQVDALDSHWDAH